MLFGDQVELSLAARLSYRGIGKVKWHKSPRPQNQPKANHSQDDVPQNVQVSRYEQILVAHAATTTGAIDSANTINGGEEQNKQGRCKLKRHRGRYKMYVREKFGRTRKLRQAAEQTWFQRTPIKGKLIQCTNSGSHAVICRETKWFGTEVQKWKKNVEFFLQKQIIYNATF